MTQTGPHATPDRDHDVVVVGGGFAGSATALLLKRARPDLKVLVVERKERFDRKVGESAIELASWFLTRTLRLDRHLALDQLPKHGLRFWFHNDQVKGLADASELGNLFQARVPSYHIDRARLDEHVLALAVQAGATLMRPARVAGADLVEGGRSTLTIETAGGAGGGTGGGISPEGAAPARREVTARWIVDATGRVTWLARRLNLLSPVPEHPTRSVWARYRGVRDFDGAWLPGRNDGARTTVASRGLSTNHLTGPGWWVWVIPLPGGETSVGVVWDDRIFDLPPGDTVADRFEAFLRSFPVGREMMRDAERLTDDLHQLNHLPYRVSRMAGDGWALVGDAAGFMDPFYSPGLDWAAITISKATETILAAIDGTLPDGAIDRLNDAYERGWDRWLRALYLDKYWYLGDAELMEVALRSEVSLYYLGIVTPPYRDGMKGLEIPFSMPVSTPFYLFMRAVNRSLAGLGKVRMAAGTWGRRNHGRRVLLPGFKPGPGNLLWAPGVVARLAWLQLRSLPDRLAARRRRAEETARADTARADAAALGRRRA